MIWVLSIMYNIFPTPKRSKLRQNVVQSYLTCNLDNILSLQTNMPSSIDIAWVILEQVWMLSKTEHFAWRRRRGPSLMIILKHVFLSWKRATIQTELSDLVSWHPFNPPNNHARFHWHNMSTFGNNWNAKHNFTFSWRRRRGDSSSSNYST